MIPLDKDNFDRQKVFYLKAVELLNGTVKLGKDSNKGKEEWKKKSSEYALT